MDKILSTIAWWAIPAGATLIAIIWVAWASRPKPPADAFDSMESHRRFQAAMEHDTFSGKQRVRFSYPSRSDSAQDPVPEARPDSPQDKRQDRGPDREPESGPDNGPESRPGRIGS